MLPRLRIAVTSAVRHAGAADFSGYVRMVDLGSGEVALKAPIPESGRRADDPNPRGGVRGAKGIREVAVRTVADPHNPKRAVIGVLVGQASQATLPFPVTINAGSIGGPSAGLAFALDILEELGHRVDRGYKVAATGEIFPDGTVGPIGGVKQKTIGARRAGVDVFLVPAGDNAQEARKYAGSLRIIPVESFQQALRVLATLPPKS